jgi:hypothetical protein
MTIDELIEHSHAMAVEKGWWDGGTRSVVDQVNNFHAEISEAWEEYRHGRMETWYEFEDDIVHVGDGRYMRPNGMTCKPEGFWVEIADLCIRIADTMCAYKWDTKRQKKRAFQDTAHFIASLHDGVQSMLGYEIGNWSPTAHAWAVMLIRECVAFAERNGIDLLALCELKMNYNATRPTRHGGLRA